MRALLLTSLSAALLAGCLTTQENPNYEFSSRYEGDTAATHQYATTTEVPVAQSVAATYEAPAMAPTDSAYASRDVSGTPGYMAMQADRQATAQANVQPYAAPQMPVPESTATAQIATAGTPIDYDHSRNLIVADTAVAPSQFSDSVRVMSGSSQSYTVEPGDTVYSLSRKTCVGVKVIQSMNNLPADYGIKIGQTLTLPAPVC
ncbi:hypothetical protein GCM10011309_01610 [Litorimonas cladophorae]|uniref:LysM domain-containing protein n=1 Tax=Litorimonas cladophorae TaxID=1220491 RepID=A0A918NBX2_9PROT|nr:LysM peptidoglycan-binding domain-containing protein [Litorimonas cladophorae]GGX56500.1 hypothetical protein GCM10011309_01610 [Litorimonas cladophorae]